MNCIIPSKTFIRNRWDCAAWMGRPFGDVISGSSFKSNLLWIQFVQPFTGSVKRWLFPDFDSIIRSTILQLFVLPAMKSCRNSWSAEDKPQWRFIWWRHANVVLSASAGNPDLMWALKTTVRRRCWTEYILWLLTPRTSHRRTDTKTLSLFVSRICLLLFQNKWWMFKWYLHLWVRKEGCTVDKEEVERASVEWKSDYQIEIHFLLYGRGSAH